MIASHKGFSNRTSTVLPGRDARLRAALIQGAVVVALVAAVLLLAERATRRLAALGINSGFGFLANRAGFNIGEAPALPEPDLAWLGLLAAVMLGLGLATLLARTADEWAGQVRRRRNVIALVTGALLVPPTVVWFTLADRLQLVSYNADRSLAFALLVGAANTLRVSAIALVLSTLAGLAGATLRLSRNWLLERLGTAYVELVRNLPLLLHLFFWYFGVLRALPSVRNALVFGPGVYLTNRGLVLPAVRLGPGALAVTVGLLAGLGLGITLSRRVDMARAHFGLRVGAIAMQCLLLVALAWALAGPPLLFDPPVLRGFNFRGGIHVTPEFFTLVVALSVYHGAYNAEIIRSGILSVPRGQREAAFALGLQRSPTFWFVIAPQALRLIIPPLISRYLGLLKSSSLAVAIGYPEIISVSQSITYATGQALEMVSLTMLFYLSINLSIALVMNRYNLRLQPAAAS